MRYSLPLLLAAALAAAAKPTVFFIRHGEKPKAGNGLNADGLKRAQCLRDVFGRGSEYGIGHIMAQRPKQDGKQKRPYETVRPLARDLGLKVDTSCQRDDVECVTDVVRGYKGPGNILICWEHSTLTDLAEALGAKHVEDYPDDAFDLIWTLPPKYKKVTSVASEHCPGLDARTILAEKARIEDSFSYSRGGAERDRLERSL